jgi:hypothetical protein
MNDPRQPELPYPPIGVPFVLESDTSVAAAVSLIPDLGRLEERVYGHIDRSLDRGCTDDELEVMTGLSHQTTSARRRTLVLKGLVQDSGRRRTTRSGRKATVWVKSEGPQKELSTTSKLPPRPNEKELSEALQDYEFSLPTATSDAYEKPVAQLPR